MAHLDHWTGRDITPSAFDDDVTFIVVDARS
jgi:hypothetical protein